MADEVDTKLVESMAVLSDWFFSKAEFCDCGAPKDVAGVIYDAMELMARDEEETDHMRRDPDKLFLE